MKTLQIEQTNALKAFNAADIKGRELLENLFGSNTFNLDPTERIKTFLGACEVLDIDPDEALPYPSADNEQEEALNGIAQIFIIARALNGDWKADFKDTDQYKYYPWFKYSGSGSGLAYNGCGTWNTGTNCGVRFAYKDAKTAEYAGKQFLSIYNKFLN